MKNMEMKELKKELFAAVNYEDDVTVAVKIFESEDDEGVYDVEVNWYQDGDHQDTWVTDSFDDASPTDNLKAAKKRAAAVKRSVVNWFAMYDEVTVEPTVEIY
ncbi:hypothetical protein JEHA107958_08540 [Jeotgalicoccus halotolerans]|uniref:Uncharacterized protein n=1 Tax=Jeotgalicoccus halotolerans TaxID=157227 RepID=A0A3E0AVK6_9STAP|nr:hypothetical protein [Jeotgalicoccus halotolerans]REG23800.1 hypothetical protein DFR63_1547 [Jeotgalicoccus halotolerans]